ncbi:MAG: NADH-quinone oxidoreductase subunit C [Candidatus Heimdallarchaeota archaeon]
MEATDAPKDLQKETEVIEQLKTAFPATILESQVGRKNRPRVVISLEDALPILRYAKDTQGFEHLSAVIGIDMIDYFAVAYMLGSWSNGLMLEVLVRINDLENPTLPSVTSLWETANWHEREVFDLFGFKFTDHPDLKRIVLPEEWDDPDQFPHEDPDILHPLRKSYKQPENPFRLTRKVDETREHIDINQWRKTIE